ncbi:hypothetical protein ANCCAN_26624 [Ancylostoma caninum]|uniref:Uncharacterized protein n=1 Tax=Ancylostoma caninum TaxID=29170 RepID=A0A368F677_ANCCA|nr:hypothetical protein ANCCAN_26624 [Ancylostoma caninum]
MHGPTECDLNRLQNCAISYFPRRHLGLITCIQGLSTLREAFSRCLSRLSVRTQRWDSFVNIRESVLGGKWVGEGKELKGGGGTERHLFRSKLSSAKQAMWS